MRKLIVSEPLTLDGAMEAPRRRAEPPAHGLGAPVVQPRAFANFVVEHNQVSGG